MNSHQDDQNYRKAFEAEKIPCYVFSNLLGCMISISPALPLKAFPSKKRKQFRLITSICRFLRNIMEKKNTPTCRVQYRKANDSKYIVEHVFAIKKEDMAKLPQTL